MLKLNQKVASHPHKDSQKKEAWKYLIIGFYHVRKKKKKYSLYI